MLREGPISTEWNSDLAYVIGLIASDGNLCKDGRHINLTSKDESIVLQAKTILKIGNKIGMKSRTRLQEKKYYFLQFGSVDFYAFLVSIGLTSAKSKTLGSLDIPDLYFADFLRGCIDGDGSIVERRHPESINPQLRVSICSGSVIFLEWLHVQIRVHMSAAGGWIYTSESNRCSLLSFGKNDSIKILNEIYKDMNPYRLERKFAIAQRYLDEPVIV